MVHLCNSALSKCKLHDARRGGGGGVQQRALAGFLLPNANSVISDSHTMGDQGLKRRREAALAASTDREGVLAWLRESVLHRTPEVVDEVWRPARPSPRPTSLLE